MDWILYVIIVLLIVAAVWAWHSYRDTIVGWFKGGPIKQVEISLPELADKMHAAKIQYEKHAQEFESRLVNTKTDVARAESKVLAATNPSTPAAS